VEQVKPQFNASGGTLSDFQQEELRQRLFLIKNRLLNQAKDDAHLAILNAFSNRTLN